MTKTTPTNTQYLNSICFAKNRFERNVRTKRVSRTKNPLIICINNVERSRVFQIIDCGPTYTLIGTDDNAVVFCGTRFCVGFARAVLDGHNGIQRNATQNNKPVSTRYRWTPARSRRIWLPCSRRKWSPGRRWYSDCTPPTSRSIRANFWCWTRSRRPVTIWW